MVDDVHARSPSRPWKWRELMTAAVANPGARAAAIAARQQARAAVLASEKAAQAAKAAAASTAVVPKVVNGSSAAVSDAWNGYWLVHSANVAKLGLNYAKVLVSHNTRKVAGYVSALFNGDTKTLSQLGNTNAVKSVGNAFQQLSSSPGVKYVGDQFSDLGKTVAKQWDKLFNTGSKTVPAGSKTTTTPAG